MNLKQHIKQILKEEHVSDLKKPFMRYEKLINKLVYDVFDEGITNATVNLQLCGSMKPHFKPYEIKYGFSIQLDDTDNEFMTTSIDINMSIDLLKNVSCYGNDSLQANFLNDYGNSIISVIKPTQQKQYIPSIEKTCDTDNEKYRELLFDVIGNDTDIKYGLWYLIGCTLNNNGFSLKMFKDWTNLYDTQNDDKIDTIWNNMKQEKNVIYGLQTIAKKRNETKYKEWLVKYK